MSVDAQKVTVYKKINNQTIPLYPKTTADMVLTDDSGNTIADVLSDGTIIKYCSNAVYNSDTRVMRCTVDGITLRTGATFILKLPAGISGDSVKLNVNNLGSKYINIDGSRTINPRIYTGTKVNRIYGGVPKGVCMFVYDATLENNVGAWVLINGYAVDSQTKYEVATAKSAGFMSAADKAKLDTIDEYADHTIVMTVLGEYTQPCSTGTVYRAFQDKVDNKLGAANGIATLDSNSKLTASQLPSTVVTTANCGVASGVATLDSNGKIPTSQLPNSISGASIEWHTFSEI